MSGRAQKLAFGFLVSSLENLKFMINETISTSKLPFNKPLVMKYYNVLAYFSLDYENCHFTKNSRSIILHIHSIYPIHINYMTID